jgi:hypothetical protein
MVNYLKKAYTLIVDPEVVTEPGVIKLIIPNPSPVTSTAAKNVLVQKVLEN